MELMDLFVNPPLEGFSTSASNPCELFDSISGILLFLEIPNNDGFSSDLSTEVY